MLMSLFLFFLKLGFVSVGGGYPMMSFIAQEGQIAVRLTPQEFADMAALELLVSGPIAINAATYIGFIKAGVGGAAMATFGVCAPSFILTAVLYAFLNKFRENKYVQAFIDAIKIACGGILLTAAVNLAESILIYSGTWGAAIKAPLVSIQWGGVLITAICVVALKKFKVNPVAVILGAAVLGLVLM